MTAVRVNLPTHLQTLAGVGSEVAIPVTGPLTIRGVLDAIEAEYPMLRGTIRDHGSGERRAYIRFYASGADVSFDPLDGPLPEGIARGEDVFTVLGAISGG
jgi:sulfur-carrier protein